jgi:hypothetical protein
MIKVCECELTLVEVIEVLLLIVACVPGVALAVLAGLNDEDEVAARLLVVIVVCISLHGCLRVYLVMLDSQLVCRLIL